MIILKSLNTSNKSLILIYNILYNNAHKITQSSNIAPKTSFYQKININPIYNNIIKTSSDHRSRIIIISLILLYNKSYENRSYKRKHKAHII